MYKNIDQKIDTISNNFINLKKFAPIIEEIANICINSIKSGNKIIFCGNGGSAADSQHLAAELIGRYKINRPAINATALTVDTSILTAVGNDFGFDTIFERQIEGIGKSGDILFGISTSGNSKNVLLAFAKAKKMGIKTVAFTGSNKSKMKEIADYTLDVPSNVTNNIQEMHIAIGHLICDIIEKGITPKTKALFLDRDGIVNEDLGYVYKTEDFQFVDGIVDLCKKVQEKDYKIIIVTNKSGVERGYYSVEDMNKFNAYMVEQFKINGVFITDIFCCLYLEHPDRKPNPGMFEKSVDKYNIDVEKSISLGDKPRDLQASLKIGIKNNYLFSKKNEQIEKVKTIKSFDQIRF